MKFNKVVQLVAAFGLTAPLALTVVSCDNNAAVNNLKTNLSSITSLDLLNNTVNFSEYFTSLNQSVENAKQFKEHNLSLGCQIKWYSADKAAAEYDITNLQQYVGTVYVQIIAASNDTYWQGQTGLIAVNLKGDLSTVNSENINLNQYLGTNTSETWSKLDNTVATSGIFSHSNLSKDYYTIDWYDSNNQKINNDNQSTPSKTNTVYIKITTKSNIEQNSNLSWTGQTGLIELTITKNNLDQFTAFDSNFKPTVAPKSNYSSLDSYVISDFKAKENTTIDSYTVNWYANQTDTNTINNNNVNVANIVYVQIIASSADLNWAGSTNRIAAVINKKDLSDVTSFSDLTIPFNSTDKNMDNLSSLNYIFSYDQAFTGKNGLPLKVGYTVNWFDGNKNKIANPEATIQSPGDYYIVITAANAKNNSDPYWTGSTNLIKITLAKNNLFTMPLPGTAVTSKGDHIPAQYILSKLNNENIKTFDQFFDNIVAKMPTQISLYKSNPYPAFDLSDILGGWTENFFMWEPNSTTGKMGWTNQDSSGNLKNGAFLVTFSAPVNEPNYISEGALNSNIIYLYFDIS